MVNERDTKRAKHSPEEHEASEPPIADIKLKVVWPGRPDAMKKLRPPCTVQQALQGVGVPPEFGAEMLDSAGRVLLREAEMQAGAYTLSVKLPYEFSSREDSLKDSLQAIREEIRQIAPNMEQSEIVEREFSQVSDLMANRLLKSVGLLEIDGWRRYKLRQKLAGLAEVEAFDYAQFADEDASTPELLKYHQKILEQHGIEFGRNAFGMRDLRSHKTALAISSSDLGLDLRGGVDAGVIPCGLLGHSAVRKLALCISSLPKLSRTSCRGTRHQGLVRHPRLPRVPRPAALQYADNRPQAICTLLAAHCATQLPLDIDLTDGKVHHILRLRGSEVLVFTDCTPAQAYHLMAMQLKEYMDLKQSRARLSAPPPELDEAYKKTFQLLQTLVPEDTTAQQMKDLMSFAPTLQEKMQIAMEFIQDHTRRGGELGLPDCVRDFYA